MLRLAASASTHASIISIDPGTEYLGVAIITFDVKTYEIIRTQAHTYIGSRMPAPLWVGETHGARQSRLLAHYTNLLSLFNWIKPVAVVSESPFFNRMRPNAYEPLVQTLDIIRQAVMDYNPYLRLETIDPPSVKNAVGAKGNAKKEVVQAAVVKMQELLHYMGTISLEDLDEHSIDAIAVGYGYFCSM